MINHQRIVFNNSKSSSITKNTIITRRLRFHRSLPSARGGPTLGHGGVRPSAARGGCQGTPGGEGPVRRLRAERYPCTLGGDSWSYQWCDQMVKLVKVNGWWMTAWSLWLMRWLISNGYWLIRWLVVDIWGTITKKKRLLTHNGWSTIYWPDYWLIKGE